MTELERNAPAHAAYVEIPRAVETRPFPELLDTAEEKALLSRAEQLWRDLQANDLGGFSGGNRPFYILSEFKRVIEEFGNRDVGWYWSKDQLDAHPDRPTKP